MYGKIFERVFTGSMFGSGPTVFAVWAYVIANTKPPGAVELNPRLLASCIGTSTEDIKHAIEFLCSSDAESSNHDEDGRRLVHLKAFEYQVVSFDKYREMRSTEDRREYMREYMRKRRKQHGLTKANGSSQLAKLAEAEAEAEEDKNTSPEQQDCSGLIASLPLVDGSKRAVTEREAAEWAVAYPAVDVRGELRRMCAWLNANPKNRKTKRGINAFVVSWLDKQQNRAPRKNGSDAPMVHGRDYV